VVRSTVEETLNAMLDAEADRLCQAERYERTEARKDTRAGSYQRQLHTKVGEVTLKVPKLRSLPFVSCCYLLHASNSVTVFAVFSSMW
jgi:putative transposase